MFGSWIHKIPELKSIYQNAVPYEHVVIPDFFANEIAESLNSEFPTPNLDNNSKYDWKHYDNPIEQKYSLNSFDDLDTSKRIFEVLQSPETVSIIKEITGIQNLESDPYMHGAGLHAYPQKGKLDIHLDYSLHPVSGKERRVNLIIYMNKDWKSEYGGNLELWDSDIKTCKELITPTFNSAVLFRTSDISYHGLPKPIQCPNNMFRKSLAIYYLSPVRNEIQNNVRLKAEFFPLPNQPVDDKLSKLYSIRKQRLIQPNDLWPEWRENGGIYW